MFKPGLKHDLKIFQVINLYYINPQYNLKRYLEVQFLNNNQLNNYLISKQQHEFHYDIISLVR